MQLQHCSKNPKRGRSNNRKQQENSWNSFEIKLFYDSNCFFFLFVCFYLFLFYFVRVCDKNLQMSTKIARFALKKNSQKGPKRRLSTRPKSGKYQRPKTRKPIEIVLYKSKQHVFRTTFPPLSLHLLSFWGILCLAFLKTVYSGSKHNRSDTMKATVRFDFKVKTIIKLTSKYAKIPNNLRIFL